MQIGYLKHYKRLSKSSMTNVCTNQKDLFTSNKLANGSLVSAGGISTHFHGYLKQSFLFMQMNDTVE